ncbi:phosphorothioated DNA-binding restriction endonuclease [Actinopolymorpha rutila]|uniref:Putative restriction endonuclease n=1 Tax=Actinopolymorpha rutila TaxID=446787 RepID=A0A852ZDE6_9ACTN|nr:putative restriction endonuclease [Actinopolymorpha rutila]
MDEAASALLARIGSLRQHQIKGKRSPHKPLLVLLALGQMAATGSSEVPWSLAEQKLAELITEFGTPRRTGAAQGAAYPFTRLQADGIWVLDRDVPMDQIGPLRQHQVTGRLERSFEDLLRARPALLEEAARRLVTSQFPDTVAPDVLVAVGLDPDLLHAWREADDTGRGTAALRRRSQVWRTSVLQAWDRQCAFCGFDGQIGGATVGIDAAHVRWFAFDGPDSLDNGLALCTLHHKLFDLGAVGLTAELTIQVSTMFTARTGTGRQVYELHGRELARRPGTAPPAHAHVTWHTTQVFKGKPLTV